MKDDLKKCPFCGKDAQIIYLDDEGEECAIEQFIDYYRVECEECQANVMDSDREEAIAKWNKRTGAPIQNCGTCLHFMGINGKPVCGYKCAHNSVSENNYCLNWMGKE